MIYFLLADGFEESEALVPFDMLKRAGKECVLCSVMSSKDVTGSHGICVKCDIFADGIIENEIEMLVLPGGMPGVKNLGKYEELNRLMVFAAENAYLCAICAAPSLLGEAGLLQGKCAVCYPGFEGYLEGAEITDERVVRDGNIITAKGAGAAFEFGFALVEALCGAETSEKIRYSIY